MDMLQENAESQEDPEAAPGASQEAGPGESMETLLAQQAAVGQKLAQREVAWVKVIQVTKDQVLVDIGEKREGMVPLGEFSHAQAPAPGQRVPVMLVRSREGGTLLSYQRARAELGWQAAVKAFGEKARVRGRVQSAIKGGFLVDVGGVSGFLPASLADLRPVRQPERMVGTGVRCTIIEVNEAKRQIVLSRKAVLEEETAKRRAKLLCELRAGEIRIGRVVSAGPAGLVVDIGGLEGFVRASDVAWGAPKPPTQERGSKVRVKILSKPEKEGQQVLLGIKQLSVNPAEALRRKYPPKSVVRGRVSEAGPAGVRIILDDKRTALCVPAECDPEAGAKPGEAVSAVVLGVSQETFEIMVSIAKFNEIRDRKKAMEYLKPPKPLTLGQLLSPESPES